MAFYKLGKRNSHNDNSVEDAFTVKETKIISVLVDIARRNHYSENSIFIRPLECFYNESLEGLWIALDGIISWYICFNALDDEYDLLDKIEDYIYKTTEIRVSAELYDNSTLLIYID